MAYLGYDFYFKIGSKVLTLPITPSEMKITIGSNNKVVTLINEGDVNILKSPSLVEFEFDARFPMRKYPYSREPETFDYYLNTFTELKTSRQSFIFTVVRMTPNLKGTWATTRRVALEDLQVKESSDEGDDVILSFKLKEYKEYGVATLPKDYLKTPIFNSYKPRSNDNKDTKKSSVYTVKSGDCLWNIAKAAYDNGAKYTVIYDANKEAIEADARKHGKNSSQNGHWIWPGLKLTIPNISNAGSLNVKKLW